MNDTEFDFKRFFNISPDLLCIAGYDGYFKKINPAVSHLLGYSENELYSRPINDFIHPEDRDRTSKARQNLKKSTPLFYFENRYVKKNGDIVWLAWTSQPVQSEKLVFAIAKNITHKKHLEKERLTLLENLTKVNKDLKQLALTTSHDLRSPLSNILTVFELFDASKISDMETLELIEILKTTGENFKQTLNSYVNVLSGNLSSETTTEDVDFKHCLDTVRTSVHSLIERSGTTIYADFSALKSVRFNKAYMKSIFLNLLTNSIKYARDGCPPEISIRTEIHNGKKQLIVTDNGSGFDLKKAGDKIFGMHQTFHNHPDSKGVGLYLVHNHVTSFGGKIEVESTVNRGTTFIITFP